jgi:DNA-binding CsgD family transcriptional regulator
MRMFLSGAKVKMLSQLLVTLAEPHGEAEIRTRIGEQLLELLDADHYASYVWNDTAGVFEGRVALNMCPKNLGTYEAYFQYHDPITAKLQARRGPTLVAEVMPQSDLIRTEFFNDFLHRDGLYWGVNLYAWDGDRNIGDMRIWRGRRRESFDRDAVDLLELIAPAFTAALRRAQAGAGSGSLQAAAEVGRGWRSLLSGREFEVVQLAAIGWSDKAIARRLEIGFTTVRTHLAHAFRKLGVENRVQLAARAAADRSRAGPEQG